jgi:hypothetical protein
VHVEIAVTVGERGAEFSQEFIRELELLVRMAKPIEGKLKFQARKGLRFYGPLAPARHIRFTFWPRSCRTKLRYVARDSRASRVPERILPSRPAAKKCKEILTRRHLSAPFKFNHRFR